MVGPVVASHLPWLCDRNDALRQSFSGGRVVLSAGVAALPRVVHAALLAEALFRLLTSPALLAGHLDPKTGETIGAGGALLVRAAPHLEIGADPPPLNEP